MPWSQRVYSRRGCLKCLSRRKKCDEIRPTCGNCRKARIACVWRGTDNLVTHFLPGNKLLDATQAVLHTHSEQVSFRAQSAYTTIQACPRNALWPGHIPLRSTNEHLLLMSLSGFLDMLASPRAQTDHHDHSHVFTVALQNLRVRDALVAFTAFMMSPRIGSLRAYAYKHYNMAVGYVQREISNQRHLEKVDELLVITVFLGLMEIYNPENTVFPLLHFEAVGHLMRMLARRPQIYASRTSSTFYRVALESYLYHVSVLSLYYPQTDRYTEVPPQIEENFHLESSGIRENIVVALDINIYRILFKLSLLARANALPHQHYLDRIQECQIMLDTVSLRLKSELLNTSSTADDMNFWLLTSVAVEALEIFRMKLEDRSLLSTDTHVRNRVKTAIAGLEACSISREWKGNLIWMLAILLCAAYLKTDFEKICQMIERFQKGIWGADLTRLETLVNMIRTRRLNSLQQAEDTDRIVKIEEHDTLAMLLDPRGILAG